MADTRRPRRPRINVLLRGAQSDGEVALTDNRIRAGAGGPPLHHHDFDEAFYVLDGELTIQLAASVSTIEAGELAFARLTGTEPPPEASKAYPETIVVGPQIELMRKLTHLGRRAMSTSVLYTDITRIGSSARRDYD